MKWNPREDAEIFQFRSESCSAKEQSLAGLQRFGSEFLYFKTPRLRTASQPILTKEPYYNSLRSSSLLGLVSGTGDPDKSVPLICAAIFKTQVFGFLKSTSGEKQRQVLNSSWN